MRKMERWNDGMMECPFLSCNPRSDCLSLFEKKEMMQKLIIFLLLGVLLPIVGFSQNIKLAYNGSLFYPGAKAGYEIPYRSIDVKKEKKSGKMRNFTRQKIVSANLGYYHHQGFHDNLYLTFGWSKRRISEKGFFVEFSPEIGVSRTFLGGTTYKVDDAGQIKVATSSGYFYPLLSIGGGFGYDFSKRDKEKPFMTYFKLNTLAMYPYNSVFYLRPTFELGFIYKLKPLTRSYHVNK
jgi:hypothetical protein